MFTDVFDCAVNANQIFLVVEKEITHLPEKELPYAPIFFTFLVDYLSNQELN